MTKSRSPWLYCLPAILLLLVFAGIPLAHTIQLSFTDARLGRVDAAHFIGLENYEYLLGDPDWWLAVWNTLVFAFFAVSLETLLGLGIALVLNERFRGRGALRGAMLLPWAVPAVVAARIWSWLFNDASGLVNEVLLRLGLIDQGISWLADDRLSRWVVILVDVWKSTPFMALLLLAGLQGIPRSLSEAARVDGASRAVEFRRVTWPLLRPALLLAMIFRTLDALRVFDLPFVLTSNSKSTAVVSVYARQQMVDFQDMGFGSAASFLIFCGVGVVACAYLLLGRKRLGLVDET